MPAVGTDPIYELTVNYAKGLGVAASVFYYNRVTIPDSGTAAQALINGWVDQVAGDWQAMANDLWSITSLRARRLNDFIDFAESPVSLPGARNGPAAPAFVTFKLRFNRSTKETRSGHKRFPGVSEDDTDNSGNNLVTTATNNLTAVANALAQDITEGAETFQQVIVGNKVDNSGPTPVLRPEADWIFNGIQSITVGGNVSSQVSRKIP